MFSAQGRSRYWKLAQNSCSTKDAVDTEPLERKLDTRENHEYGVSRTFSSFRCDSVGAILSLVSHFVEVSSRYPQSLQIIIRSPGLIRGQNSPEYRLGGRPCHPGE